MIRGAFRLRAVAVTAGAASTAAAAAAMVHTPSQALGAIDYGDAGKAAWLNRIYQAPEVVSQRKAMVEMLKPAAGERVLDIGCGPGFMMQDMADAIGTSGHLEGIDPSEIICKLARTRLADLSVPYSVRVGGAEALPYEDESFDAVVLAQVLLYVPNMSQALSEVHRVLRPGGRVLICDTDWDSLVVNTSDKARLARLQAVWNRNFLDPHVPPKLPGLLKRANLVISKLSTFPMIGAGKADESGNSYVGEFALAFEVDESHERDKADWLAEQRALSDVRADGQSNPTQSPMWCEATSRTGPPFDSHHSHRSSCPHARRHRGAVPPAGGGVLFLRAQVLLSRMQARAALKGSAGTPQRRSAPRCWKG